jgi:hypothetical protein
LVLRHNLKIVVFKISGFSDFYCEIKMVKATKKSEIEADLKKLALLERQSFKVLSKPCDVCGIIPTPGTPLVWAFVCLINEQDGTLDEEELFLARYKYLKCEREGIFLDAAENVSWFFLHRSFFLGYCVIL